jgi:hypothetical protein
MTDRKFNDVISRSTRKIASLKLGNQYEVGWGGKTKICTFIKTSDKGFNFYDPETHTCLLKKPLFIAKNSVPRKTGNMFYVNTNLSINPK